MSSHDFVIKNYYILNIAQNKKLFGVVSRNNHFLINKLLT